MAEEKRKHNWLILVEKDREIRDGMIIPFPDDLLATVGWSAGDILDFHYDEETGVLSVWKVLVEPDSI